MTTTQDFESVRTGAHVFLERSPHLKGPFLDYLDTVYQDGALTGKTKRLAAICGALLSGCIGCIVGQTEKAITEGASVEEVLEICAVAMSLGGTVVWSNTSMVINYLQEGGLLE